jgi:hypothetical protein
MTYYDILGLSLTSAKDDILTNLIRGGDEERFKK